MPENPRDRQDIRTSGGTVALGTCSRRPCSRVPRLERRPRQPPPPASIVVTKYSNDNPAQGTLFTRPLCPYPLHAYYTNGDPPGPTASSAASTPARARRRYRLQNICADQPAPACREHAEADLM
jgi:hypothetical protein